MMPFHNNPAIRMLPIERMIAAMKHEWGGRGPAIPPGILDNRFPMRYSADWVSLDQIYAYRFSLAPFMRPISWLNR
jgi:hypothetical protein